MHCIQTITVFFAIFITVIIIIILNYEKSYQIQQKFEEFVEKFNKSYKFNATDRIKRFTQFKVKLMNFSFLFFLVLYGYIKNIITSSTHRKQWT